MVRVYELYVCFQHYLLITNLSLQSPHFTWDLHMLCFSFLFDFGNVSQETHKWSLCPHYSIIVHYNLIINQYLTRNSQAYCGIVYILNQKLIGVLVLSVSTALLDSSAFTNHLSIIFCDGDGLMMDECYNLTIHILWLRWEFSHSQINIF